MRTATAHDKAARDVLIPPVLKEVTFTGVKNFLDARRDYERRLQDYNSRQPRARSIPESVIKPLFRWQDKK